MASFTPPTQDIFSRAQNTTLTHCNLSQVGRDQTVIYNFNTPHGIVPSVDNEKLTHLLLEQVHIDVCIVDVSARVTVRETFVNTSRFTIGHVKYVFPVPAGAAVCAFEMHFADGHVMTGISKGTAQVAREHKGARQAGRATRVLDWVTDDMFIISVGSIPAKERVTTNLVFVMDLIHDEIIDEVRLQLPMSLGSRRSLLPATLASAPSASIQIPLFITVDIQMSGVIRRVTSHTHPNIVVAHISHQRQTVTLRSQTFLTQNFVLAVRADGLDAPRCFAEQDPRGSGTVAMQLTVAPNFKLPPISAQEYLFVVDRSGSMAGPRIQMVKQALLMLLRMLPEEQTLFNIFSFENEVDSLWQTSQPYHQSCVDLGTKHIHDMTANYGSAELCAALKFVCRNRSPQISTMVFLLTDGMVHSSDKVISVVANAVASSRPDAPLRVFALGIGHEVSSAVIEGIARAGNGICLFAVENESIENKCAKLLHAGRFPCVENVSIDWGAPENLHGTTEAPFSVNLPDSVHVQLGPPANVQQSPNQIPQVFPGIRFVILALTTQKTIPKQVRLHGKFNGGDGQFVIEVPVSTVKIVDTKGPDVPLIHTLSARNLITDLLERRATLPTAINPTPVKAIRMAAVVQLGVKYQLATRFTSFVAVYKDTDVLPHPSRESREVNCHPGLDDEDQSLDEISMDDRPAPKPLTEYPAIPTENGSRLHADNRRPECIKSHLDDATGPDVKNPPEHWTGDDFRRNDGDAHRDSHLLGVRRRDFPAAESDREPGDWLPDRRGMGGGGGWKGGGGSWKGGAGGRNGSGGRKGGGRWKSEGRGQKDGGGGGVRTGECLFWNEEDGLPAAKFLAKKDPQLEPLVQESNNYGDMTPHLSGSSSRGAPEGPSYSAIVNPTAACIQRGR